MTPQQLVDQAAHAFAGRLGSLAPTSVPLPAALSNTATVLDLHVVALLAVLELGQPTDRNSNAFQRLLDHETKYWLKSPGAPGTVRLARQAVAAAALLGVPNRAAMREALGRVSPELQTEGTIQWYVDLYHDNAGTTTILQPDRLAERLVVDELTADPELAGRLLNGLGDEQARSALTLLSLIHI